MCRTITTITAALANTIGHPAELQKFIAEANCNHYTMFTHQNFFYSYPEFGKDWSNGKMCEFHRVNTKCHLCDWQPERNYAGYGTIYLLNNGVSKKTILIYEGIGKNRVTKLVPNTHSLSRMILLCPKHISGYFEFNPIPKKNNQLTLF